MITNTDKTNRRWTKLCFRKTERFRDFPNKQNKPKCSCNFTQHKVL